MMNKEMWVRPVTEVQTFEANEYVAACGDSGANYYFKCNAPKGTLYYYTAGDGTVDGKYTGTGSATELGSYTPCSASPKHAVDTTTPNFYDGFVDYNKNGRCDSGEEVIVWSYLETTYIPLIGPVTTREGHATKELDMQSWETAKS